MTYCCTRKIEFDAAHRVMDHKGKCYRLHGHRYVVEASFISKSLSELGMVIDFTEIKSVLGNWIDENWDHNTILNLKDKDLGSKIENSLQQKIYYLQYNPTAENMAKYLLNEICPKLFKDSKILCFKIRLYETPNCYAEVAL